MRLMKLHSIIGPINYIWVPGKMLIDAKEMPGQSEVHCDICVIGAGAAGITFAREFLGKSNEICILESGGLDYEAETQSLYQGENIGLPYTPLDVSRLRYFGGTTNHWAGVIRPNDAWSFEKRSWIINSGWPITASDLEPYYKRAADVLFLPPGYWGSNTESWEYENGQMHTFGKESPLEQFDAKLNLVNPVRMGQAYRNELQESKNVTVYLHSNVLSLESDASGKRINGVKVSTLDNKSFSVSAKYFILAAGGIENPRILLLSNSVMKSGVGNDRDVVGRYFADHIHFTAGHVSLNKTDAQFVDFNQITQLPGSREVRSYNHLFTTRKAQTDHQLTISGIRLLPISQRCDSNNFWDEYSCRFERALEKLGVIKGQDQRFQIRYVSDPVPNPDSRVTLSNDKDKLGLRKIKLNWQSTDLDLQTARKTIQLLSADIAHQKLGRINSLLHMDDQDWPDTFVGGAFHHMGTTRMSENPNSGVVDSQCKVHGIANLFVAGSSVFPTYGLGSPTYLIIALTIRLADQIKRISNA